jgi:SAM-dependent methyltransferase
VSKADDSTSDDSKSDDSKSDDTELLGALDLLWQRRAPYHDPITEIVRDTLAQFPPPLAGVVVEVGAGSGQLRAWMPATWRDRMVHTDPSAAALHRLRERAPDAKTRNATAERLPFDDGTAAAVVGLCMFDAVDDPVAVVAEAARVLSAGGRFIHFMDMATLLERPFAKLAASHLVPIPNVFGDPVVESWPHGWPLDVVLVKRDWLDGLLKLAGRMGHPLSSAFGGLFGALLAVPFDAAAATTIFKSVAANAESRDHLKVLLESVGRLAFQRGYPAIEPLPFHSSRYLQSVLQTAFRESDAFRIQLNELRTAATWRPREATIAARYRSLCLGHQRIFDDFPPRLLTTAAQARLDTDGVPPDEVLVEAGVFVFVAVRS